MAVATPLPSQTTFRQSPVIWSPVGVPAGTSTEAHDCPLHAGVWQGLPVAGQSAAVAHAALPPVPVVVVDDDAPPPALVLDVVAVSPPLPPPPPPPLPPHPDAAEIEAAAPSASAAHFPAIPDRHRLMKPHL
jgi:hypothetical protein